MFREALAAAASAGRSGRLLASTGLEDIGEVVFHRGQIAWAVCAYQPEDLGTFLIRLGHLSRDQLFALRGEYTRRGGGVKFGKLLEESGLISRPVLRHCLLLHVRVAVACLLHNPHLVAEWEGVELAAVEEVLFPLAELRLEPASPGVEEAGEGAAPLVARGEPFSGLAEVPGYRGTVVAGPDGVLVAVHGFTGDEVREGTLLAIRAAVLLEAANQSAADERLGEVELVVVRARAGSLVAGWLEDRGGLLVATLAGAGAHEARARFRLTQSLPAIRTLVAAAGP